MVNTERHLPNSEDGWNFWQLSLHSKKQPQFAICVFMIMFSLRVVDLEVLVNPLPGSANSLCKLCVRDHVFS